MDQILTEQFGEIGWGGNSGFHAVNLAVQFGASRIALCGFDMSLARGVHWHGRHPAPLINPQQRSVDKWREILDGQARRLSALGIEVFNCSEHSALANFPKLDLLSVLRLPAPSWPAERAGGFDAMGFSAGRS